MNLHWIQRVKKKKVRNAILQTQWLRFLSLFFCCFGFETFARLCYIAPLVSAAMTMKCIIIYWKSRQYSCNELMCLHRTKQIACLWRNSLIVQMIFYYCVLLFHWLASVFQFADCSLSFFSLSLSHRHSYFHSMKFISMCSKQLLI